MKKTIRIIISALLTVVMLLSAAPLSGFVGLDLFATTASAASYGVLKYGIVDGEAIIYDCDQEASGEITIPSTIDGYPITRIRDEAFYNCKNITSVILPNSLQHIGRSAFFGCNKLTSITIPVSVTSVGSGAFFNTDISENESNWEGDLFYIGDILLRANDNIVGGCTVREGTRLIASNAFFTCDDLTDVKIPNSVEHINSGAFVDCINLTNITIPESVKTLGAGLFNNCESLTSITIPEGITVLDSGLFNFCTNLKSVELPDSVTSIEDDAFFMCKSLTEIAIPNKVTSIGFSAFEHCSSLKKIVIPDSVTVIKDWAFNECTSLSEISLSNSLESIGQKVFDNTPFINNSNNYDNHVLYIGNCLLKTDDPEAVNGVYKIKEGTRILADGALAKCKNMTAVVFPDGIKHLGSGAFGSCSKLSSITIPDGITVMKNALLSQCTSLVDVKIPNSVKTIEYFCFWGCTSLYNIIIPDGVTRLDGAFDECTNLRGVKLPNSITVLEGGFDDCENLTSIEIPDSVTTISNHAFFNCSNLNVMVIPDSVTNIEEKAMGYFLVFNQEVKMNNFKIICHDNTAALKYAKENGFNYEVVKGELPHSHTVFVDEVKQTCTTDGYQRTYCKKCNEQLSYKTLKANINHVDEDYDYVCDDCGIEFNSSFCPCDCHKKTLKGFVYRVYLVFCWIFKINERCYCGEYHY